MLIVIMEHGDFREASRDPYLSWKAKGILREMVLLNGHHTSINKLKALGREGRDAIQDAIKELEAQKYLVKAPVRVSKQIAGWAYVLFNNRCQLSNEQVKEWLEGQLNAPLTENQEATREKKQKRMGRDKIYLPKVGYGISGSGHGDGPKEGATGSPLTGNQGGGKPVSGKTGQITLTVQAHTPTLKERTARYITYAEKLAYVVKQTKNIKTPPARLRVWANEIRKLVEMDGVSPKRVREAIMWYRYNAGGQYIPVIESGEALRRKFTRLEDAMKREGDSEPEEEEGFNIPGVNIG